MDIYTVEIGKLKFDSGSVVFVSWMEFEMFDDDLFGTDKWLSAGNPNNTNWPYTGEWTRSASNKQVILRRNDAGRRLARLDYKKWPWTKGTTGVAKLDEPFDGEKEGIYKVTFVN